MCVCECLYVSVCLCVRAGGRARTRARLFQSVISEPVFICPLCVNSCVFNS